MMILGSLHCYPLFLQCDYNVDAGVTRPWSRHSRGCSAVWNYHLVQSPTEGRLTTWQPTALTTCNTTVPTHTRFFSRAKHCASFNCAGCTVHRPTLHCAVRTGCCNMSLICVMDCTPTTLCIVCFLLQILILFVPHLRNLFQRGLVQDPTVGQWSTGQQNTESHFHFASGNQPSCASHWGRRGYQLLAPKFVNVTECAIMWLNVWDEICTRV